MLRFLTALLIALTSLPVLAADAPDPATLKKVAAEVDAHFQKHILHTWFPRCIDNDHGGFIAVFDRNWKPGPQRDKFLVFQARMTWLSAQIAMRRPDLRDTYLGYTRHGLAQLEKMWDPQFGGLFWSVDANGKPADRKHLYGISFGIYGASAAYRATGDRRALDLALKTFRWMDQHAHDDANGGYHELLSRDGTPIATPDQRARPSDATGYPNLVPGYKSQNTHIHLLESITELYIASKDPLVKQRLEELLALVRDRIVVAPGCLNLFYTADWKPVPDYDSFGHDIETAYLLVEASDALGRPDDEKTWRIARSLVDHTLDWGYDSKSGGIYDKGAAFESAHDKTKVWWSQAETLNSLLLMHQRYGQESDRYWKAFLQTWNFVNTQLADNQAGGWYWAVDEKGAHGDGQKGNNWKGGYHDGRALMNIHQRLLKLAGE